MFSLFIIIMPQQELFKHYELDNSKWKSTLFKILGGSLVLHVILVLSAVYVPAIRDAFYIAMIFSETEISKSNEKYDVTMIEDVMPLPPSGDELEYPSGYFALANGDAPAPDFASMTNPYVPEVVNLDSGVFGNNGFSTEFDSSVNPVPQPFPTVNPVPPVVNNFPNYNPVPAPKKPSARVASNRPSAVAEDCDPILGCKPKPTGTKVKEIAKNDETEVKPNPVPSPKKDETVAEVDPNKIEIKNQAWIDYGNDIKKKIADKSLDLSKPATVTLVAEVDKNGVLIGRPDKDGKIIPTISRTQADGDPEMINALSQIVAKLNESEMLRYLKFLKLDKNKNQVVFDIVKTEEKVLVNIKIDSNKANSATGLFNFFLEPALADAQKKGREEALLLSKLKATPENNQKINISFEMPAPEAMQYVDKKLANLPVGEKPMSQKIDADKQLIVK